MVTTGVPPSRPLSWLAPHLRGHLFLFDPPPAPAIDDAAGVRLLLIVLLLEVVLGPRLGSLAWLGVRLPPAWMRIPVMLAAALLLTRRFAGVPLAAIGLRRCRDWTLTETSWFFQMLPVGILAFSLALDVRWVVALAEPSVTLRVVPVVATSLLWGVYQEVVYRGLLQTALVRRWGAPAGILASNALYTLGPLHAYYFVRGTASLPMLAAIFAIGLVFAVIYRRSGNLWIVAIFHGMGNAFTLGAVGPR